MWRCTGLRWAEGGPAWTWWHPRQGERSSPLRLGGAVALAVPEGEVRRCVGVWRSGRWTACPRSAAVPGAGRRDQCEACAALDRSQSVAADTKLDDPRPYAVYLAWFGPGLCKVGITGAARGHARLLEQAAVCFTFLGRGPLMAARRAESVLGTALGIPDRVSAPAKRAARMALPPSATRAAELRAVYDAAAAVPAWRETLSPLPYEVIDQAAVFGLAPDPPRPAALVTELAPGTAVDGVLRAAAGSDLYVDTAEGTVLLDAHLASGWALTRPTPGQHVAPARPLQPPADSAEPLF
ncbi:DUF2797 domain-containing protein [Actinacidiphila soli]|uniref:DUF2797 domain-containing protein n=1 Tax=Actinacidiphila soli TaxID=2487275 RepID=UPI000FC9FDAE|nr:DUF2797 domain-containing protein [Actinacidiphila soli]